MQLDKHFNIVTNFLAYHNYQPEKHYDLILVLGSAIPSVALEAYKLYKKKQATYFMIAGGKGHTTDLLINQLPNHLLENPSDYSEAYLLKTYIESIYGEDETILLEELSTNCGLNMAYAYQEIERNSLPVQSILLCHDPLLQRRMDLTAKKQFPNILFENYCSFIPEITHWDEQLQLVSKCPDQWPLERYISLTLGEMVRIINDENGYGPKGLGYIEAVDIPQEVMESYWCILKQYKQNIRKTENKEN